MRSQADEMCPQQFKNQLRLKGRQVSERITRYAEQGMGDTLITDFCTVNAIGMRFLSSIVKKR
jgi:hypothetical protein